MTAKNYTIRPISLADLWFLWEMLYQSLYVHEGEQPFNREVLDQPDIRRYVEDWGREGDLGFVATEISSDEDVGAAWLRVFTEGEPGYAYVADDIPELGMAVLPQHRSRGVGSALLGHLLESTAPVYQSVSLSVSASNPAVRLYKRMGFERVNSKGGSITMIKNLNNEGTESKRAT
jgi:ribosomal protein S18 acetylase RimI-like enzyme